MITRSLYLSFLILVGAGGLDVQAAAFLPNVMLEFDNSGSMTDVVQSLPAYSPSLTYVPGTGTGIPSYTAGTVYQLGADGTYTVYANSVSGVVSAGAQFSLNSYGLWVGTIGNVLVKLFMGNYLNYETCPNGSTPSSCTAQIGNYAKIAIAKQIVDEIVSALPNAQFGVMDFNSSSTGGHMVASIPTSSTTIVGDMSGIVANTSTPLGPTLTNIGQYYAGTFSGYSSPINSSCQSNSVIIVTDGEFNVPNSKIGDPVADPAVVATGLHKNQNLIINTIGLDSPSDPLGAAGVTDLQNAAANGGGVFFDDNTTTFLPQLEQALFSLPASISMTAPANLAVVSGTVQLTAAVQNSACIAGVQFTLDGNPIGSVVTAPPFNMNWDSTQVLNGTHTVAAVDQDFSGNLTAAPPIIVIAENDQTPPVINNVGEQIFFTSATITWLTNKPADSQIDYGLTVNYNQQTLLQDTSPRVTTHTVVLGGLTPDTLYNFEILSRDSAGNLSTLGNLTFTTQLTSAGGSLDHFVVNFLSSNGVSQSGPGTQTGTYPFVLPAASCFSASFEGMDALNNHSNYTGPVTIAQYLISGIGLEIGLSPGIATADSFQLGASSLTFTMTNGFLFLGSATDFTQQLCFYRATEEPGDSKTPGAMGDQHLRIIETGTPSVTGISASYIVWRGQPSQLALVTPGQALAPATPTGVSGSTLPINQGVPFTLQAYLTDKYWNQVLAGADNLQFTSSLPLATGFDPFSGYMNQGLLVSSATVNACSSMVTLSVNDLTNSAITPAQVQPTIAACGSQRFYQISAPSQTVAGQDFPVTIMVSNLNIPSGGGSVLFSGTIVPLVQADPSHFAVSTTSLGVPLFSFSIPAGTVSTYTYTIPNEIDVGAGTIYLELVSNNPSDLQGATAISGPVTIAPGPATRLTVTASPPTVAAYASSQLTATLSDAFGNGISGQDIILQLLQGSGALGPGGNLLSQALVTNSAGQAVFTFKSGAVSETDNLMASAPAETLSPVNVQVQVSLLNGASIAAYPSPVKITQRPLTIEYELSQDSDVTLTITDLFGREVWSESISAGAAGGQAGPNRISWNGVNGAGITVAVGVYAIHLTATANSQTQKMYTRFGVSK